MANVFELPSKDGNITPEKATNAVSRQNSVCLGSALSMGSFAIDEPRLPARALYATLSLCKQCFCSEYNESSVSSVRGVSSVYSVSGESNVNSDTGLNV